MTAIATALEKAGMKVKPPSNMQRIWTWLKDHPEKTYADISAALNIPKTSTSSLLSEMEARKMVKSYRDMSRRVNPATGLRTTIKRFSTLGSSYELLPLSLNPLAPVKATDAHLSAVIKLPAQVQQVHREAAPTPRKTADDYIKTLNVYEARGLYTKLQELFKG